VFCRDVADHLPTIREAVACPYFSDPAMRSGSGQQSATKSSFQWEPSSGPACGYSLATSVGVPSRHSVIFSRSRMRGDRTLLTRSNKAKLMSVTPRITHSFQ
jgi:hypothetical protein